MKTQSGKVDKTDWGHLAWYCIVVTVLIPEKGKERTIITLSRGTGRADELSVSSSRIVQVAKDSYLGEES
jgi:hypothetical protein